MPGAFQLPKDFIKEFDVKKKKDENIMWLPQTTTQ